MSVFAIIGALVTLILCSYGLLYPKQQTEQANIGLRLETPVAVSELRATYGAMVAISAAVLISQSETVALVLGIAWIGSFIGRMISLALDKSWCRHVAISSGLDLAMFTLLVPLA